MANMLYFKPSSLKEASDLLIEHGENSCILNGGTDVVVRLREKLLSPSAIIDIKSIPSLKDITFDKENGLFVGACANLGDIAHKKEVFENYSFLADACESVGSGQIRNRATLAGNNCNASPLADTSTPLLTLDAVVKVYSNGEIKDIPINEFFVGVRKTVLKLGEIVTGIQIPYYENMSGIFYKNSRRKEVDLSTMCATIVKVEDKFKIALGAVAPTPIRAPKAEEFLHNNMNNLSLDIVAEAGKIAASECSPIDDVRSSKEYRKEMVAVLVKRALIQILGLEVSR